MGTPQSDLAHVLSETATTEEVVSLFEELEPVQLDFMTGRWRGAEIPTGHPMGGVLTTTNWYGKEFVNADCVHPLLFSDGKGGTYKVSLSPALVRMTLRFGLAKTKLLKHAFSLFRFMLRTEKSQAHLRMMEHCGQFSAAMIYDHLPIYDLFKKIDDDTVLGLMTYAEIKQPFFFKLKREMPNS